MYKLYFIIAEIIFFERLVVYVYFGIGGKHHVCQGNAL